MVMIFKSKKALNFLLTHGEVYTLRPKRRKEGRDWITDRRGGKKIANVEVELVAFIDLEKNYAETYRYINTIFNCAKDLLGNYVEKSGFQSVGEWLSEGRRIYKGSLPNQPYLYHVRLVGGLFHIMPEVKSV